MFLTHFSDGMLVVRELLRRNWSPVARALVTAMPLTMVLLAFAAKALFSELTWAEAFCLPRSFRRHTLNLESGGRWMARREGRNPATETRS